VLGVAQTCVVGHCGRICFPYRDANPVAVTGVVDHAVGIRSSTLHQGTLETNTGSAIVGAYVIDHSGGNRRVEADTGFAIAGAYVIDHSVVGHGGIHGPEANAIEVIVGAAVVAYSVEHGTPKKRTEADANPIFIANVGRYGAAIRVEYGDAEAVTFQNVIHQFTICGMI
jgi:hypothetical protein